MAIAINDPRRRGIRPFAISARELRQHRTAFLFLLPTLLIYATFMVYPFFGSIQLSLTNWNGVDAVKEWVGLDNYVAALTADPVMQQALWHNVIWIVAVITIPLVLGLLVATILWDGAKGQTLFRTAFFMPYVLPSVAIGIIFGLIYNPIFGALNGFLRAIGLDALAGGWLAEPNRALPSLIAVEVWASFGFNATVLLAALQNIDQDVLDAAKIDGANVWQRFVNVLLPQLGHVITLLVSLALIGGFKVFDLVYIMTGGGPGYHTEVVATHIFQQSFARNLVGYGTALSLILTAIILVASILFIQFRERRA
ncbi:MAG: carbohydrate ABC transporter permease [Thermomicrobiales bacterium]